MKVVSGPSTAFVVPMSSGCVVVPGATVVVISRPRWTGADGQDYAFAPEKIAVRNPEEWTVDSLLVDGASVPIASRRGNDPGVHVPSGSEIRLSVTRKAGQNAAALDAEIQGRMTICPSVGQPPS